MRYCFDIDGVICFTDGLDYENARPNTAAIERINALFDAGHTIVLQTARGMGTLNGDVPKVYEVWYETTFRQMEAFGLRFHQLFLGKTHADVYVDDKGQNSVDWLEGQMPAHLG